MALSRAASIRGQIFGCLKTIVRLLFQTALDDARRRAGCWDAWRQFRRRFIQHRVHASTGVLRRNARVPLSIS